MQSPAPTFSDRLRTARVGLLLSLLAVLFGYVLGGTFGSAEDQVKAGLAARAEAVRDTIYAGDDAALQAVLSKSWSYTKRAHMHGGGIGNTSVVLILLICALARPGRWVRWGVAMALGVGALGYSVFWLIAAYLAPSLGSTAKAKEALEWLAFPSAGLLLVGVTATVVLVAMELFGTGRRDETG